MNNAALFNLLLAGIGGPGVFAGVFLIARALVHSDGREAYAKEYLRQYRAEKALERRDLDRRDAELVAAADEVNRRYIRPRRRPVAAVGSAPHADTRWSVLNKEMPR